MLKIKKAGVGFYLLILSFVFGILGLIWYESTYSILRFTDDRLSIAMTIISLWLIGFLIADTLLTGNNPFFSRIFYGLAVFMLTYSLLRLLTPCLTPIGIYFTVGNMGDVETNKIAVPKSILATVFYAVSIIALLICGILGTIRKERAPKEKNADVVSDNGEEGK